MNQRFSAWKDKTLSLEGRVTLTKSVLQALPTYGMQSCIVPKGVCDDIDTIYMGEENGQRRFHPISWNRTCQPFIEEGLVLRSMRDLKKIFMMKAT